MSLIAGASLITLFSIAESQAQGLRGSCEDAPDLAVLPSPLAPWKGAPLRVLFATDKPLQGELSLIGPDGKVAATSTQRYGGPPYFWIAEVATPAAGTWHAKLTRENAPAECGAITREIAVRADKPPTPRSADGSVWPLRNTWNCTNENLYSAWIEKLFDAPLDASLSWPALHVGLRDELRNFLFNHLSLGEDSMKLFIRPDCADLPYFLRAYFAFKMGLPFGYSKCTRGSANEPPKCYARWNIQHEEPVTVTAPAEQRTASAVVGALTQQPTTTTVSAASRRPAGLAAGFGHRLRSTLADGVHSGSGRTRAADDNTDYYPVPLNQDALRPGAMYADPYGHILVLAKRVPQTDGSAGVFLAVDAQPDGTVARKRFWRGNFLFAG